MILVSGGEFSMSSDAAERLANELSSQGRRHRRRSPGAATAACRPAPQRDFPRPWLAGLDAAVVRRGIAEAEALGVREVYFTGGDERSSGRPAAHPVQRVDAFWFAWAAFNPSTTVWTGP
jgi:hypothetical protein